jgi:hypothetical protein
MHSVKALILNLAPKIRLRYQYQHAKPDFIECFVRLLVVFSIRYDFNVLINTQIVMLHLTRMQSGSFLTAEDNGFNFAEHGSSSATNIQSLTH